MGFGAEMKDFISGFKTGTQFWDDVEDNKMKRAQRDKIRKPTDEEIDAQPGMGTGANKVGERAPSSGYDYSDINIKDDPEASSVLGFIRKYEGGEKDPYNKMVGGGVKPLTSMSVQEVLDTQKSMISQGHESTALGAYQFINPTLQGLVNDLKIDPLLPFDQAMQDQLGYSLLQRRGWNEYKSGAISKDKLMDNLAGEWAALPLANGKSAYEGVGSNKAGVGRDQFASAVPDIGAGSGGSQTADTGGGAIPAPTERTQTKVGDVIPVPPAEDSAPPPAAPVEQAIPTQSATTEDGFQEDAPVDEPQFDEYGNQISALAPRQQIYGGLPTNPLTAQMSRPVVAAADGGAIPAPAKDPYNPGRAITVISPTPTSPANSFVPRRVGASPMPGATPTPVGPSESQVKFRDAQARAAIPAPVAAPQQATTIAGWGAREGQQPTVTNQAAMDKMTDQQLQQLVSGAYMTPESTRNGKVNPQLSEQLQYARWRLGEQGYQTGVAGATNAAKEYDRRVNYMGNRNHAEGGMVSLASGGTVPPYETAAIDPAEQPLPPVAAAVPTAPPAQQQVAIPAPRPVSAPPAPPPVPAGGASGAALPVRDQAAAGDEMIAGPEKTAQNPRTQKVVSQALDQGVRFLTDHFGLKGKGAVPGKDDGANSEAGSRRFAEGEGAATRQEVAAIDDKIDPERQLSEGDRQMQRISKTMQWYLSQGRKQEASAVAASLMQYGAQRFGQLGSLAGAAYSQYEQTGDPQHLDHTLKFLDKAYEMVPDGASFDIAVDPKSHKIIATRTDSEGKTEEHPITPQELPKLLQSVQNKSLYWNMVYHLADPAGATAKDNQMAVDARNKENLKFREKQTIYTQGETSKRAAANQTAVDKRTKAQQEAVDKRSAATREDANTRAAANRTSADERAAANRTSTETRQQKSIDAANTRQDKAITAANEREKARTGGDVDFDALDTELSAAEEAKKAWQADTENTDAKAAMDAAASALFKKLPKKDRMKRMAELGFPEEDWDYVGANPVTKEVAPTPDAPTPPAAARVGTKAGTDIGSMAKQPAPAKYPDAKRGRDKAGNPIWVVMRNGKPYQVKAE